MSSIRLRTISDFIHHDILVQVFCRSCGHRQELDPTHLYHLFVKRGWTLHLHSAQRRFRCAKCRTQNAELQAGGLVKKTASER